MSETLKAVDWIAKAGTVHERQRRKTISFPMLYGGIFPRPMSLEQTQGEVQQKWKRFKKRMEEADAEWRSR